MCIGLLLMLSSVTVHANNSERHQITALFLYNFANFVEWPERAFVSKKSPLRMCLFGDVPFSSMMDAFDGALIGERELGILMTNEMSEIESGCHILFVGNDQRAHLPNFFKQIQYSYVLSVSDKENFLHEGGIINIVNTSKQLQFDINLTMASANKLTISSDLLSLARKIKRLKPQK